MIIIDVLCIMKAGKNKVVSIHYQLNNEQGILLDTSANREPLTFLMGHGALIEGLENALLDRQKDDKFTARIGVHEAYGEYDKELVHIVPKANFNAEGGEELEEGIQVTVNTNNGTTLALVSKIDGEDVTLDLNHPLAGMNLVFDIEVMAVRDATNKEINERQALVGQFND